MLRKNASLTERMKPKSRLDSLFVFLKRADIVTMAESLLADQRNLQNQFLNDVPNGEFLGEFIGLWLLGLDMVPLPASQQNVQLYINRGCECAMEAWFIQPTDSAEPTDPNVPTVGSNSCPQLSINLSFPFKITEMSSSFSITTLTDPNIKSLTVELLDENKKAVELSYKLGTDKDLEVTLPGEEEKPIVVEGTRLAKGAYVLHLEIVENYYFLFKINGTQFGIKYWPKEWMKHNQTKWIKVQSQLLLLQDPIVKQNEKEGNELQQSADIKMKYFASFVKLKLEILMGQDGFYARSLTAPGAYTKLCPYYLPKNAHLTTKPSPPWAIDHVQVIFGSAPTNATKISVEDEQDTTVHVLEEDRTHKKYPLRKKINYTKIDLKNTRKNFLKWIKVKIIMRGPFNPDAEVRINLFNRALEFHELFGATVLMLKLRKTWAAINSFKDGEWLEPWRNETLYSPLDFDKNDDEPNIKIAIAHDKDDNDFDIEISLGKKGSVKDFEYQAKVPINNDIQYLTVEHENVVFDYEVELQ
ncbi:hypothetical protein niasHT_015134 [Heterodera trifolii]|uniref:Uncharacterized protein n=1 Tax=Heterodera trifolii TaxID=157864 RepID=A0ABD2L9U1_9BILA